MKAASNASPLIYLAKIKRLELLKELFDEIIITEEVYNEITAKDSPEVESIKNCKFLQIRKAKKTLNIGFGLGENAAISSSLEENCILLIDDHKAKIFANAQGIKTLGTLGLLLLALSKRLIGKEEFRGLLSQLVKENFRISIELYNAMLEEAEKF